VIQIELQWMPADDLLPETLSRLGSLLQEWKGTPYMPGVCGKQQGVDCARWCCSVLAEMEGLDISMRAVPQDAAFHHPSTSWQAVRQMQDLFRPVELVTEGIIRPGYLLLEGPIRGGPAHAMLVGPEPGLLWHSTKGAKVNSTPALLPEGHHVKRIYRTEDRRNRWLK
jgi:hypothetical protein